LLERQLEAAVEFFDQCVPNQPGYTSSIAAITMVPDAKQLTKVWGKWYACGNQLRRLRYLKALLERRREMKKAGQLSLHEILFVAPVSIGSTVKEFTTEKIAEGIKAVRGLGHRHESTKQQQGRLQNRKEGKLSSSPQLQLIMEEAEDNDGLLDHKKEDDDQYKETSGTQQVVKATANSDENKVLESGIADSANMEESRYYSVLETESFRGSTTSMDASKNVAAAVDIETGAPVQQSASPRDSVRASTTRDNAEYNVAFEVVIGEPTDRGQKKDVGEHDRCPTHTVSSSIGPGFKPRSIIDEFEYDEFDPVIFAKWLGYSEETELDQLIDTLDIEQLIVFDRETSQSASNPCVYGWSPKAWHLLSIKQLELLVEDTWAAVREANAMLLLARAEMFDEKKKKRARSNKKEEKEVAKKKNDIDLNHDEAIWAERNSVRNETSTVLDSSSIKLENDQSNAFSDSRRKTKKNSFQKSGLRKRGNKKARPPSPRAKYRLAQKLVKELTAISSPISENGEDSAGCCHGALRRWLGRGAKRGAKTVTRVLDHPSYCVVTFTSRQAAIAARQCLADGKGIQAWEQVESIPMHPIADAPPRNLFFCRGCCRPVTLTIPDNEKRTRSILTWVFYVLFCLIYTVPLTLTSQLLSPTKLASLFPDVEALQNSDSVFFKTLAGISTGYIYTLFFSVLPQIFKLFAFSEGSSSSKAKAEEKAMRFYWYFMLVTAFTGQSLVQMLIDGIFQGNLTEEFKDILGAVAGSIATTLAPTWLNWIIVRTGTILPMNYLLQTMTFVYGWLRIPWLNRVMRGGGPGGPPPYRIYIDSGVVFMCLTSLAPACPIIAPMCLLYYSIFIPILRWLHIFVYRPFYDGGGNRLPVIHEIIISSLILSQLLLGTVLFLKQCFILGIVTTVMTFPTLVFSQWTKDKFERSYNDAGLWQTSKLDGLSNKESMQKREKYRRWLVDAHKASYVPICLSGGEDFLTNQPAVVVPIDRELLTTDGRQVQRSPKQELERKTTQKGATFRRYM